MKRQEREMTREEEKAGESARQGALSWKKDVKRLMEKDHDFWEKLNDVENVYVLEFSFSDVDLPYIKKVAAHVSMVAMWHIGWHEVGEDKKFSDRAYACGANMVEIFHF